MGMKGAVKHLSPDLRAQVLRAAEQHGKRLVVENDQERLQVESRLVEQLLGVPGAHFNRMKGGELDVFWWGTRIVRVVPTPSNAP